VLDRLDQFRGLSRFTTWAYKFVVFEVSTKVARHAWCRQPPGVEELASDELPDLLARRPEDCLEQRAQLDALSRAIGALTDRQREVLSRSPSTRSRSTSWRRSAAPAAR
jgi:RNA polymerase sigma-70 factor, ECF subfamily